MSKTEINDPYGVAYLFCGHGSIISFKLLNLIYCIDNSCNFYNLTIAMNSEINRERYTFEIKFINVKEFRISSFGGVFVQINDFNITNIADRGWDEQFWEVSDRGRERLFFRCADIDVISAKKE